MNDYADVRPRRPARAIPALFLGLAGFAAGAGAAATTPPDWEIVHELEHIALDEHGNTTTRREFTYRALTERGVAVVDEQRIRYHAGHGHLEDVQAHTLKADGARIEVPPTNVQVTSYDGIEGLPPAFSDYRVRRLVYPDVAVGDSVVLAYTLRAEPATFAGRHSTVHRFRDDVPTHTAELIVSAPEAFGLHTLEYRLPPPATTAADGRRQWRWTYRNPSATDHDDTSQLTRIWRDHELPMVLVSNFADHLAIAQAYRATAAPKAVPTARVRELAARLVAGIAPARERAERLYEWVRDELDFAGNCLAGGDVVPRDTELVLNLRRGDCKDHATLLEALLASQGIVSEQVLIHSGNRYELTALPCWQSFNHVINYLPEFDVYLDASSGSEAFGHLALSARGKPVLHAGQAPRLAATAAPTSADMWSSARNEITVSAQGDIAVTATYTFGGANAHAMRSSFAALLKMPGFGRGERLFTQAIEGQGYVGDGYYAAIADTEAGGATFDFTASYRIDAMLDTSNPYGVALNAFFPSSANLASTDYVVGDLDFAHDFQCLPGRKQETIELAFPPTVTLLAVPHDVSLDLPAVSYHARYRQHGNRVSVTREIIDRSPGPVCAADVVGQYRELASVMKRDLQAQAVYMPRPGSTP